MILRNLEAKKKKNKIKDIIELKEVRAAGGQQGRGVQHPGPDLKQLAGRLQGEMERAEDCMHACM